MMMEERFVQSTHIKGRSRKLGLSFDVGIKKHLKLNKSVSGGFMLYLASWIPLIEV
ncbi:hypothetical protein QG37_07217 [Candidozyma auris]|uniref:Uncharacterized protein n=1 Tax=Candidozyma auris TaxID=498019 RepID=A0A0L0NS35_CANAR|nr:hypothetical protein QG37_07217 [[Candida] auris]